ncbi:MAG: hypothetical protein BWY68_00790 [bacterium ADurb.Bin400]|nr:MAG: hypothetical protein BWY68_00790 [bacterium ADurb.Bin400]
MSEGLTRPEYQLSYGKGLAPDADAARKAHLTKEQAARDEKAMREAQAKALAEQAARREERRLQSEARDERSIGDLQRSIENGSMDRS